MVKTKTFLRRAFETQLEGRGFSFVEILTMCPTGWFVPTAEGPAYLDGVMGAVHAVGAVHQRAEGLLITDLAEHLAGRETVIQVLAGELFHQLWDLDGCLQSGVIAHRARMGSPLPLGSPSGPRSRRSGR